jgi:putative hydrolase of HD superfamily
MRSTWSILSYPDYRAFDQQGSSRVETDRLSQQIAFIIEMDRLKGILRQTLLTDSSRRENSAEHSWHLALMAMVLAEHADVPIDVARVVAMLLVHDVVEIDAGDTFCYDTTGVLDQAERERQAADRLFGLLPAEQGIALRALWEEFDARETPDARFAAAMDRLQPLLHNLQTGGGTWRIHGIRLDQVIARTMPIAAGSSRLWAHVRELLDGAVAAGMLTADLERTPEEIA